MDLKFGDALEPDAAEISALRTAVAVHLTRCFGRGHWSSCVDERAVLRCLRTTRVLVARAGDRMVATLALGTKKPWAIDTAYFTAVRQPLYLTDMAVDPEFQRLGIGRRLLAEAVRIARSRGADALRLDAYDADAGAGPFYAKCGFRETGRAVYRMTPLVYFELVL